MYATQTRCTSRSLLALFIAAVTTAVLVPAAGARGAIVTAFHPSGEPTLKSILETQTGTTYDLIGDQIAQDIFTVLPGTPVQFELITQYAGHAENHRVGYYQPVGISPIGPPPDLALTGVTFLLGDIDADNSTPFVTTATATLGGSFGLFLDDRFYASDRLDGNGDVRGYYPSEVALDPIDDDIHFAIFKDKDSSGNVITGSYLIGIEDLHGLGDRDYNDFVFRLSMPEPERPDVPEPATVLLMSAALPILLRRRKRT